MSDAVYWGPRPPRPPVTSPLQLLRPALRNAGPPRWRESLGWSGAKTAFFLTPLDKETDADDGLSTASDVARLRLSADWVVAILQEARKAGVDYQCETSGARAPT